MVTNVRQTCRFTITICVCMRTIWRTLDMYLCTVQQMCDVRGALCSSLKKSCRIWGNIVVFAVLPRHPGWTSPSAWAALCAELFFPAGCSAYSATASNTPATTPSSFRHVPVNTYASMVRGAPDDQGKSNICMCGYHPMPLCSAPAGL